MPKVSVILPNYNHHKYLQQRIDSILSQDFQDYELIVLDDASTDSSVSIVESYHDEPKISVFEINDVNSGSPFRQWQKGIELAKGEYIWIAESDDVASSSFLSILVDYLDNDPLVGVAFCPSIWIDEKGNNIHIPGHEEEPEKWSGNILIANEFLIGNVIYNASSAVFRKSLVSKVSFAELSTFKYAGDWLFWVQLLGDSKAVRTERRLNFFRRHDENVSFKSEKEGLQFVEGLKIVSWIFKNKGIGFWKRRKTMLYWARRFFFTKLKSPDAVLKTLPLELRTYVKIFRGLDKKKR